MGQYWIADVPGSTVTSSEAERVAVLGRDLSSTTTAAAAAALADAVATTAAAAALGAIGTTDMTASAVEIANVCDGSRFHGPLASTALGTGYTLSASNTGKLHLLAATTAANCAILFPAEASGLYYKFVYVGGAAEGQNYTFGTEAAANFFIGGIVHLDLNSTAGLQDDIYSDGNSNSLLTVTTPAAGTQLEFLCNGTSWYVWGTVMSDSAPAFSDT